MKAAAVIDLGRNQFIPEVETASIIQRVAERFNLEPSAITVVARPDQDRVRTRVPDEIGWTEVRDVSESAGRVRQILTDLANRDDVDVVELISYNGEVLNLASSTWGSMRVHSTSTKNFRTPQVTRRQVGPPEDGKQQYRSRVMGEKLAERGRGPFSDIRHLAWGEMQKLIDAGEKLSLVQLVSRSATDADRQLQAQGKKRQPLGPFCTFCYSVLTDARVMRDPTGQIISNVLSAPLTVVNTLEPGWVPRCDGELILTLADVMDISIADVPDLCRAIHHSSSADCQEKLHAALYRLHAEDLIELEPKDGNQFIRRKLPRPTPLVQPVEQPLLKISTASQGVAD